MFDGSLVHVGVSSQKFSDCIIVVNKKVFFKWNSNYQSEMGSGIPLTELLV